MKVFDMPPTFDLALFSSVTKLYTLNYNKINKTVYKVYNVYSYSLTLIKVYCVVFWDLRFPFFFSYRFRFPLAFRLERTVSLCNYLIKNKNPGHTAKYLQSCSKCVLINFYSFQSGSNYSLTFTSNTSFSTL